eukprot:gene43802-53566_t
MASSDDPLLYRPFKLLGMITDDVPFALNKLGDHLFVTVAVGNVFQVFNLDKLALCLVSRAADGIISLVEVYNHYTFCAVDNLIHIYLRANIVETLQYHTDKVTCMLTIGSLLISVDSDNHVKIFDAKAKSLAQEFQVLHASPATCVCHPHTYVNKVLLGFADGALELWNVRSAKHLHTFTAHLRVVGCGGAVASMAQSGAADVLAAGFLAGRQQQLQAGAIHFLDGAEVQVQVHGPLQGVGQQQLGVGGGVDGQRAVQGQAAAAIEGFKGAHGGLPWFDFTLLTPSRHLGSEICLEGRREACGRM